MTVSQKRESNLFAAAAAPARCARSITIEAVAAVKLVKVEEQKESTPAA